MKWSDKVERWRPLALEELKRFGVPLPVDLILAVIHVESRGYPGSTNDKSGASGLMQVMPNTLKWYNKQTGDTIPLSQLRSKAHPAEQIRTGVWVLAQFWRSAYKYLKGRLTEIPTDELAKIADLFYVAGPGATRKRLDKLEVPFFEYVEQRYPEWNALPHPRNVWKKLPDNMVWPVETIDKWLGGHVKRVRKARENVILLLAVSVLVYWWFIRRKS